MPELVFSDKEQFYLMLIQSGVYIAENPSLVSSCKEMLNSSSPKLLQSISDFNGFKEDLKYFINSESSIKQNIDSSCDRIYIDGCWDIMHSGHFNAIRQAKMLGKTLVVGIHSDEEILRNKGMPVMCNEERIAMIKSCKWVDEVVENAPYSANV